MIFNGEGDDIRMKVCNDRALALGNWDVLVTRALNDGEWDVSLRHLGICQYSSKKSKLLKLIARFTYWYSGTNLLIATSDG